MARVRAWGFLLVAGVLAAALQGCVAPSAFPSFDRPLGPEDALPPELSAVLEEQSDDRDVAVRFVAEHEGLGLYLLQFDLGSPCLAVAAGENSGISCGGDGRLDVQLATGETFELAPAPIGQLDGWTVLSENVRVRN